jgi:tyrosine-protein phosphatase non-receptor type 4
MLTKVLISILLVAGSAIMQFEQLYRRQPSMSMNACRLAENVNKNRYRDVSPYDATRVILKDSPGGDYINASFVNVSCVGLQFQTETIEYRWKYRALASSIDT